MVVQEDVYPGLRVAKQCDFAKLLSFFRLLAR